MNRTYRVQPGVVVVSDVHLDGTLQARRQDEALSAFVDHLAAGHLGVTTRLVLLGDVFDLLAVQLRGQRRGRQSFTEQSATAATVELLRAHRRVVDALRHALAAGIAVDYVAGNHDVDIARPAVQAAIRAALGGGTEGLAFHPWLFHLPGVLYAEHGHHHHDLNAGATPLVPFDRSDGELRVAPGAWLDGGLDGRSAGRVLSAGVRQRLRRLTVRRSDGYREALARVAGDSRLPEATVATIDRMGASAGPRLVARAVRRRFGPGPSAPTQRAGYLHRAALAVDGALRATEVGVPCYVFGHTHVGEVFPLAPGGPVYGNSGTWSSAVPNGVGDGEGRYYTFLRITVPAPQVELLRWDEGHRVSAIVDRAL